MYATHAPSPARPNLLLVEQPQRARQEL